MFRSSTKNTIMLAALSLVMVSGFQNCSPARFTMVDEASFTKSGGDALADDNVVDSGDGLPDVPDDIDATPTPAPSATPSVPADDTDDEVVPTPTPSQQHPGNPGGKGKDNENGPGPGKDSNGGSKECVDIPAQNVQASGDLVYVDCPGNSGKQCVVVCHVPKGNPENAKTHIFPLAALHGHEAGSHGGDYYGSCNPQAEIIRACEKGADESEE